MESEPPPNKEVKILESLDYYIYIARPEHWPWPYSNEFPYQVGVLFLKSNLQTNEPKIVKNLVESPIKEYLSSKYGTKPQEWSVKNIKRVDTNGLRLESAVRLLASIDILLIYRKPGKCSDILEVNKDNLSDLF